MEAMIPVLQELQTKYGFITEAVANQKVALALDMGKMGKAVSVLSLAPVSTGTVVIWSFEAPLSGIKERWSGLMFDNWIGGDYEKGLANLKALTEKEAAEG